MKLNEYISNNIGSASSRIDEASGFLGLLESRKKQIDGLRKNLEDLEKKTIEQYISYVDEMVSKLTGLDNSIYTKIFGIAGDLELEMYRLVAEGALQVIKVYADKLKDDELTADQFRAQIHQFVERGSSSRLGLLGLIKYDLPNWAGSDLVDIVEAKLKLNEQYEMCKTISLNWDKFCKAGGVTWN